MSDAWDMDDDEFCIISGVESKKYNDTVILTSILLLQFQIRAFPKRYRNLQL